MQINPIYILIHTHTHTHTHTHIYIYIYICLIIDREEHWRIRSLKESAHMLGYSYVLSRLSKEMNTK